ncbi:MAG TPA: HD domain-containing phosphohydrolase [Alphaproteobacteria bacterium]|nr:HD domain-containing phosphohydrolase [Alphaproteobacteria bacterium]
MSDAPGSTPLPNEGRIRIAVILTSLALVIAAAVGVALVFRFVASERARDLRDWQVRLGIVADSRVAAVEGWLNSQWSEVGGVANNDSVRLLLTQLKLAGGNLGAVTDGAAQAEYIGNLLAVTADRAGFTAPILGPDVRANVKRVGVAGLAVLDIDGRTVVETRGTPSMDDAIKRFVVDAKKGSRALRDMTLDAAGKPSMAFLMPIYAVQGDPVASQQVGWVLGVKEVGSELYPLLKQPGTIEKTAEAELVRRSGAVVDYLSPLASGVAPLTLQLAISTADLAASAALAAPGGFGVKRDYRDHEVLYTSRAVDGAPWVLVYKVDRAEALADTDLRQRRLIEFFLLAITLVTVAIVAVWRHGASRRASAAATRYRVLADRFEHQGRFLRLVTDSQPNAIFIADEEERYRFANKKAADDAGVAAADLIGKTLAAVLGPEAAKRYTRLNRTALEDNKRVSAMHRVGEGRALRVLQSQHTPLQPTPDMPRGVLVVEEDVTAAITERERRERTLHKLVKSLVTLVDQRDPYSAHHSSRVAAVARSIAQEMGLDPVLVETAETAGNLMNLGKILVPPEILTKSGNLSEDEIAKIRDSLESGADVLEGIEFDGPVVATLRQCRENWDGTGRPLGLKGDAILPTARVVSVANDFVAMVSARAHRSGLSVDQAIGALMKGVGTRFDRGVVVALVNYLDNKGGRKVWEGGGPGL